MKKKLFIMFLGVLLVVSLCGTAMAKPPGEEAVVYSETVSPQGTAYLISFAGAMLKDEGDLQVTIGGFTQTWAPKEYISGRVYLQRWNGSRWVNVDSRLFYRFNHFYTCGEKLIDVTPGFYRAHSIHYAEHEGVSHTMYVTTGSRYVY